MASPLDINPLSQTPLAGPYGPAVASLIASLVSPQGGFLASEFWSSPVGQLISAFQGRPKMLDTIQATQRLAMSNSWPIQALARNFAILVRNDAPLSSGNPKIQAQIREWIGGTVATIGQALGATLTAAQVGLLDQSIRNVITSQVANPGTSIDKTIVQVARQIVQSRPTPPAPPPPTTPPKKKKPKTPGAPTPPSVPAPPVFQPQPPSVPIVPIIPSPQTVVIPPTVPLPMRPVVPSQRVTLSSVPNVPSEQTGIVQALKNFAAQHPYLQLGGCVALAVAGQATLAAGCLEELLATQVSEGISTITTAGQNYLRSIGRALRGQPLQPQFPTLPTLREQPSPNPSLLPAPQHAMVPQFPSQPQPYERPSRVPTLKQETNENGHPILDQTGECATCGSRGRLRQQIQTQQGELSHEIEIEQEQDVEEQLQQTQQELSDLSKLEGQPASQRNIPDELRRKQALQSRLDTLGTELSGTQPSTPTVPVGTPSQPSPILKQDQSERLKQDQIAQQHFQQQVQEETPKPAIQFCVGCQSQEDAILFLNGEPSACSVVPGSTQLGGA